MKIILDQDCIDYGIKGSTCFCPVAHAIRRSIDNFKSWVEMDYVKATIHMVVGQTTIIQQVKLPRAARKLAFKFDRGETITPTEFEIPELKAVKRVS